MTAARLFPPKKRTSEPMAKIAKASPAAAVKRGFTFPFLGAPPGEAPSPIRVGRLEDQAAVGAVALHPDRLVDADRRRVLRPDEETDGRHLFEQEPAEVAHTALCIALVARRRIDPDLLNLRGRRCPRRCLGLEQDHAALDPEP